MSAAFPVPYQIKPFSSSVNRALRKIHPVYQQRLREAVEALAENPRPQGALQLRPGLYRIRVGDYRVIFRVDDLTRSVEIGRIESRGERTYRDLRNL